jgi:hypothetical protein
MTYGADARPVESPFNTRTRALDLVRDLRLAGCVGRLL